MLGQKHPVGQKGQEKLVRFSKVGAYVPGSHVDGQPIISGLRNPATCDGLYILPGRQSKNSKSDPIFRRLVAASPLMFFAILLSATKVIAL